MVSRSRLAELNGENSPAEVQNVREESSADVRAYAAHRQEQGIIAAKGERKGERIADVSNGEINRELQHLKRIFNLAVQAEKILRKPHIPLLEERNTRAGFFELPALRDVLKHLPESLRPVIQFAYITGWRITSEVLPLEWRQIDFRAGEIRLDPETTKNRDGRVFPMTDELRALLKAQEVARTTVVVRQNPVAPILPPQRWVSPSMLKQWSPGSSASFLS